MAFTFNKMVKVSFTDQVTAEQKPEGDKGDHLDIWKKCSRQRKQLQRSQSCLAYWSNYKETKWVEHRGKVVENEVRATEEGSAEDSMCPCRTLRGLQFLI